MATMTSTPEGDQSPWARPSETPGAGQEYGTGSGWGTPPTPGYGPPSSSPNPGPPPPGTPPQGPPTTPGWGPSPGGHHPGPVPPAHHPGGPPPVGYAAVQSALRPGIVPLRPLTVGEILDGSFRSVRANPGVMFGMTAAVVTLAVALQAALQWYVQGLLAASFTNTFGGVAEDTFLAETFAVSLAQILTQTPTIGIAVTILTGLLIVSVSRSVIGHKATAGEVWAKVKSRALALVAFSVLLNLVLILATALLGALVVYLASIDQIGLVILTVAGGLLALTVLSVWLLVRTVLVPAVLVLEEQPLWRGIARGWRLTRGSFWRLLGIGLLAIIIVTVVTAAVAVPGTFVTTILFSSANPTDLAPLLVDSAIFVIAETLATVFLAAVIALLYIDVRMRREGLDVALARAAAEAP